MPINYPAASSGVLTTQSGKDLRGKPRGIQPEEIQDETARTHLDGLERIQGLCRTNVL